MGRLDLPLPSGAVGLWVSIFLPPGEINMGDNRTQFQFERHAKTGGECLSLPSNALHGDISF